MDYKAEFPSVARRKDVMDGTLYRQFVARHAADTSEWFTLTTSVDGTAVYESSHQSAYPAIAVINELPPWLR